MEEEKDCIFCKIVSGEIPCVKIWEDDEFLCFPDANPKVKGHCLIIPKTHFTNIMDLPASLGGELVDAIKKIAEINLGKGAEGFNLVMNNFESAGQVVSHAHIHLLPRKKGDGFKAIG